MAFFNWHVDSKLLSVASKSSLNTAYPFNSSLEAPLPFLFSLPHPAFSQTSVLSTYTSFPVCFHLPGMPFLTLVAWCALFPLLLRNIITLYFFINQKLCKSDICISTYSYFGPLEQNQWKWVHWISKNNMSPLL